MSTYPLAIYSLKPRMLPALAKIGVKKSSDPLNSSICDVVNCDDTEDTKPYIIHRLFLTNLSVIRAIKWRFPALTRQSRHDHK